MHFEEPVRTLDDLHGRLDRSRFERGVGHLIDRDTRRDLDPQRSLKRHREKTASGLTDERSLLRLKRVEKAVRTKYRGHP
jgi:hypothetical protein